MSFWKRRKRISGRGSSAADTGRAQKAKKSVKRSPPVAIEVKILAIEALESGLSASEVGELVGVGLGTIHKWRKDYEESGLTSPVNVSASRLASSALTRAFAARRFDFSAASSVWRASSVNSLT